MIKNVTYYLGAGASYNALPILNEMDEGMTQLKVLLEQGSYQSENKYRVIEDLRWILEQSNDYFTIDTLAKKFYIQNRILDLNRLKRGLSSFFILEQFRHKPSGKFANKSIKSSNIDLRYMNFLASLTLETNIIYETIELPPNVNIITWNYDMQFELAYARYMQDENSNIDFEELVTVNIPTFPFVKIYESSKPQLPKLIHLNGVAGVYGRRDEYKQLGHIEIINMFEKGLDDDSIINEILERQIGAIYDENNAIETGITYSWEQQKIGRTGVDLAREIMEKTDILVIIGYSFPFFNRNEDKYLLSPILKRPTSKLPIIYYQDPTPNSHEHLRNKFNIKDEINIIPISDVFQFHLPYEM